MPEVSIVVEENSDYWATWSHVFQGPNVTWLAFDLRQIMGNFFIGLQATTINSWDAQIPPKSNIISATMEFTPFASVALTPFDTTMNTPNRFQSNAQAQDPFLTPFDPFEGWRQDLWSNQEIAVVSTTFTFIAQPIGFDVGNREWAMRFLTVPGATLAQNDLMGQRITAGAGNTTVSFISYQMRRVGNPTGNIICHIQGVTFDRGVNIPDGVDILNGTSIPIAASVVTTSLAGIIFRLTTDPLLTTGVDYFLVIEVEYTADVTNYITIGHLNEFLSDGQLFHFGEGLGHDFQNFPGQIDLQFAGGNGPPHGQGSTNVTWPINEVTIGVTETSPDISQLIQDQVDEDNYTIDAGIMINLGTVDPVAQNRIMRSNLQVPGPGPILRITYGDPIVGGDDETHDRFNNLSSQIHREDEDLIAIGHGMVEICNRYH